MAAGCRYRCASQGHSRKDSRDEGVDAVRRRQLNPRCLYPDFA